MKVKLAVNMMVAASLVLAATQAQAAIALDRTRVIFPGSEKSASLTVTNENPQLPYLAQGWIENDKDEKITSPFIVLPPVQRVEAGSKTMVKIQVAGGLNALPQDRESLFYFNLREIPPRSNKTNVLQLALQTKIKMFYRPAGLLKADTSKPWQESVTLSQSGGHYTVHNPTPYYVTINDAHPKGVKAAGKKFRTVMVTPKSDADLGVSVADLGQSPALEYINDYGGRPTLNFSCSGGNCQVTSSSTN